MHAPASSEPNLFELEDVSIRMIHVGDYIHVETTPSSQPDVAHCVVGKASTRLAPHDRVTGWRIELLGGATLWLPDRARVTRRRFDAGPRDDPGAQMT